MSRARHRARAVRANPLVLIFFGEILVAALVLAGLGLADVFSGAPILQADAASAALAGEALRN